MSDYFRYHGLGNDYLVLEPAQFCESPSPEAVRLICDRHRGVGADGILWGPLPSAGLAAGLAAVPSAVPPREGGLPDRTTPDRAVGLRIFNPDGSEAEKSGNGLRIFARHLWARQRATTNPFSISTLGGLVEAQVLDAAGIELAITMGTVTFRREAVPMTGAAGEVLREHLLVAGESLTVSAANIGNPHCVVLVADDTAEPPDVALLEALALRLGPDIERHPSFPNRTNVQFLSILGASEICIAIWERGAGYTLASGSSSCAAAAVAVRLGYCRPPVTVRMPGGTLRVDLDADYRATLSGPVAAVGEGTFAPEFLQALGMARTE